MSESDKKLAENVVVIGAGLNGAAAAYQLKKIAAEEGREVNVTVLEASPEGVARGASIGFSRIARTNTFEKPEVFMPMSAESNRLGLEMGSVVPTNSLVLGNYVEKLDLAKKSAADNGLKHEVLEGDAISAKYPYIKAGGLVAVDEEKLDETGYGGGVLNPAKTIKGLLDRAKVQGAEVRYDTSVSRVEETATGVNVTTADGNVIEADRAIIAAGPWAYKLLNQEEAPVKGLKTAVDPLYYYKVDADKRDAMDDFPVFMLKIQGGPDLVEHHKEFTDKHPPFREATLVHQHSIVQVYFMKEEMDGELYIKMGVFKPYEPIVRDPDQLLERAHVTQDQKQMASDVLMEFFPGLAAIAPSIAKGEPDVILFGPYSGTPDYQPIISPTREGGNITVMTGCCGVGAKYAVASGEIAAAYALDVPERIPEAARDALSYDRPELVDKATYADKAATTKGSGYKGKT